MPINHLYHTWKQRILELYPQERKTRVSNFAWLLVGIFESRSVYLSRIAGKIAGQAKRTSTTRRLRRFLDNPAIRVREWYAPIPKGLFILRLACQSIMMIVSANGFWKNLNMMTNFSRKLQLQLLQRELHQFQCCRDILKSAMPGQEG